MGVSVHGVSARSGAAGLKRFASLAVFLAGIGLSGRVANGQTVFVSDTFTGTNGTALTSHAPDTGGTWAPNTSSATIAIQGNEAELTGTANPAVYVNGATPASANYVVEVTGYWPANANTTSYSVGVVARASTNDNPAGDPDRYQAYLDGSGAVSLYKHVSGVNTSIGTGSIAAPPATAFSHQVALVVNGSTITVFIDATQAISITDSSLTAAGYAGIRMQSPTGISTLLADNFIASTLSSTAVTRPTFTATRGAEGILLRLQTAREVANLGFNLYREQNGQRVKLNPSLLAGSALLGGPGTTFTAGHIRTWQDDLPAGAGQVAYWVEEIDLSGASKWYGPAIPDSAAPPASAGLRAAAVTAGAARDGLRGGDFGSARAVPLSGIGRSATASTPAVTVAAAAAATPASLQTQWSLAAGQAVKLGVSSEGWYRVTQPQLAAAGLNSNVNPASLQLYVNGTQQPILVETAVQGRFGPQDAIDFYGLGLNTIWSGTQQYWLVAGNGNGLRIGSGNTSNGSAGASSFPFTIQWQPRTVYFAALLNGNANANSFFGPVLDSGDPLSQALTVTHLNTGASGSSALQVTLQGASAGPHAATVTLNGSFVGNMAFRDFSNSASSFVVPNSYLNEGANSLRLTVTGGATDVSLVDTVLLTYPHSYIADNNSLRLTADSGRKVTVSGFSGSAIQVIDITNPGSVSLVPASVSAGAVTFVPTGGGTRTVLAVAGSQFASPASITANHPSSWHSAQAGGDMVIVSHASLLAAVAPLAALRQSQGHAVKAIDVADLYDEFNFGVESPYAIQSFLSSAQANWTAKPAYVLLMGNGTFDPRNYLGSAVPDLLPVKLVDATLLETASDDWFADFNNDGIPEMAIGRIPAESVADAATAVNRLIAYDQSGGGGWKYQALLVAGVDENSGDNFEGFTAAVKALLPGRVTATTILAGSDTLAPADVLAGLNAGEALVNYVGHGSVEVWADGLLSSQEVAGLTNGNAAPFVLSMTCLNGFFQDVYTYALAKALLTAPNGGAVAVWASSGLTDASPQSNIDQAMVKALYGAPGTTIGQAARAAKSGTTNMDVRRTWILFGDPAMKLQ